MVGDNIFYALFVSNIEIKLLKKKDPVNESGLGILLKHEVSKREIISEDGGFRPKYV